MSEPRSRRDQRKEETRRDLLASAAEVFAEEGFSRASLERIARRAGFTTGAIYWHFGGKDDLFLAVFEEYALVRVGELSAVHASAGEGLAARGRALADQWMRRQAKDPRMVIATLEFATHAMRVPRLREELATRLAAVRLAVGRMIEEDARAAGVDLPMPAQEIATALRELGVGLAIAQLVDPEAVPERLYGDFVETFYALLSSGNPRPAKEIAK